ncbi:hypothetical protein NM688_g5496 [Phlebia brevispora]|uniref:Uncharacterized protein n=1 Tax=Phlebia brevispora TaxID=194682 RepID=A0ACC1SU92_9APHY|nr:hypothetical protein NM688_g5496 [Phlebia brevispora]
MQHLSDGRIRRLYAEVRDAGGCSQCSHDGGFRGVVLASDRELLKTLGLREDKNEFLDEILREVRRGSHDELAEVAWTYERAGEHELAEGDKVAFV